MARVLVRGDPLLGELTQFVDADRLTRFEDYGSADFLTKGVVRYPHHGYLGDSRMLVQRLLDFARIDVVPAANDQVLLAVDDEVVTVPVDDGDVTGGEPSPTQGFCSGFGLIPLPLHHIRTIDLNLTRLAR